jgi:glutathione transport system substrate-binding protein
LVEGFSTPDQRSDRVVLEANTNYWEHQRRPQLQRIVFDNTLSQHEAVELVKTTEGRVDLVTGLSPLETLRVAQSPFATVVKKRGSLTTVFGQFNLRKRQSPWHDIRLRQAVNVAINREALIRYATEKHWSVRKQKVSYPSKTTCHVVADSVSPWLIWKGMAARGEGINATGMTRQ